MAQHQKARTVKALARKAFWNSRTARRFYELWCWVLDGCDRIMGRRHPLVPPRTLVGLACGGRFNFLESGRALLRYLIEQTALQPNEHILDIGCGPGRFAVALTDYLSPEGSYDGLDIVPAYVRWCTETISPRAHNFRFHLADVSNAVYRPDGPQKVLDYTFPFSSESFDLVLLSSVFTHMKPDEVRRYLGEVGRVLRRGKWCAITYFLWNPDVEALIRQRASELDFPYDHGCYRTLVPNLHEADVCYSELFLLKLYQQCGLSVRQPIAYGSWSGRRGTSIYQDLVIATKM